MINLKGKRGIVTGIANKMSISAAIAKLIVDAGGEIAITYQGEILEKRVKPIAEELGCDAVYECDVQDDNVIDNVVSELKNRWGKIDFLIHSIAFANKEALVGRYVDTKRDDFLHSLDISCYSLVKLTQKFEPLMSDGGSIVTMTYHGAQKVIQNYNVMGVAKAALESSVRYLANDLGEKNIRVNAISAGPVKTLAASGIGNFKTMLGFHADKSPLKRNVTQEEVAGSALYFISDLSSSTTGEVLYVDSGYNIVG